MATSTVEERMQQGKNKRRLLSRVAHADPHFKDRQFDPIEVLRASAQGRVPRLLRIKYARMKASPFAFFRGSVHIMAADLGRLPNTGLYVQLCGDAHLQNMGSFATAEGRLVFDLNDFDETIRGPWEWDVKRMATSIMLAGYESDHNRAGCSRAVEVFVQSYYRFIDQFSKMPVLQGARHQIHREKRIQPVHAALRQSERARPLDMLKRFTEPGAHGQRRFRDLRPALWRVHGGIAREVLSSLNSYRTSLAPDRRHLFDLFRSIDVGFKIVGTGSVGLRDYVVLLEGNGEVDPVFLQIKQEVSSAYAKYLPPVVHEHHGRRAAQGQRAIQPISDLLLGWTTVGHHQYLVRQLNDHKGKVELQRLRGEGLTSLALVAGELLARGHARAGDACQIFGYCGSGLKIVKAITAFARHYADQTEADYGAFVAGIKSGKIKVGEEGSDGQKS